MDKTEFLQGLKAELEGRVPYSVIQENLRYYDSYISGETAKGTPEEKVIEDLGGPRIIARTIVDAAFDTEDRPDGYETFGSGPAQDAGTGGDAYDSGGRENPYDDELHRNIHYVDFSKWYVRVIAGLIVFFVIFLIMSLFFGLMGLVGAILVRMWPVLLVLLFFWMISGMRR